MRILRNEVREYRSRAIRLLISVSVAACLAPGSTRTAAAPADPPGRPTGRLPVRLEIPAVGIDAPIEPVGRTRDGYLGWTSSDKAVGWYSEGFRPGEVGNSILVGHVRMHQDAGPAALWRLDEVMSGDEIVITMRDATQIRYVVSAVEEPDASGTGAEVDRIFGEATSQNLNIITHSAPDEASEGGWSRVAVFSSRLDSGWSSPGLPGLDRPRRLENPVRKPQRSIPN